METKIEKVKDRPVIKSQDMAIQAFNAEQLRLQIEAFSAQCTELEIVDPTSEKIAEEMLGSLNQVLKKIENRKDILKRPALDHNKFADAAYKYIVGPGLKTVELGKDKIAAYREAVRIQKSAEESARIKELASKESEVDMKKVQLEKEMNGLFLVEHEAIIKVCSIDEIPVLKAWYDTYCAPATTVINASLAPSFPQMIQESVNRMIALKDARKAFIADKNQKVWDLAYNKVFAEFKLSNSKLAALIDESVEEQSQALQVAIQAAQIEGEEKPKGRFVWDYEVVSWKDVPESLKMIDDKAVKNILAQYKDQIKDGDILEGIRYFKEEIVVLR